MHQETEDSLNGDNLSDILSERTAIVIDKIIAFNDLCRNLPIRFRDIKSAPVAISAALNHDLDRKLQSIGEDIEYLAEMKYDAPRDSQFLEITNEEGQNFQELLNSLIKYNKARFAEATKLGEKLEVYADLESHPVQDERWEVWYEKEPEIFAHWFSRMEKIWALNKRIKSLWYEAQAIRSELYEKRSEAIIKTLNDVGVRLADPNTALFSSLSENKAVLTLKEAVKFYPQFWVDASNTKHWSSPLFVEMTNARGRYSPRHQHLESWAYPVVDVVIVTKPEDWQPDLHDLNDSCYVDLNGEDTLRDPLTPSIIHRNEEGSKGEGISWALISYEYHKDKKPPTTSDWERVDLYENENSKTLPNNVMKTYYRKPLVKIRESNQVSRIRIKTGDDFGMRSAIHEFGHRVCHLIPTLMILENCFLNRRAGNYTVKENEIPPLRKSLSLIVGSNAEYGYADIFPVHYMGRIYEGDSLSNEIFATGMEALFAGSYGGFTGAGYETLPDVGFKRFILGILAACANDNDK